MSLDLNAIFDLRVKTFLEKTEAAFAAIPKPQEEVSDKGKRIARVLRNTDFAGHRKDVIELIEAITGEAISKITGMFLEPPKLPAGIIVVPITNDDEDNLSNHNYTAGVPIEWNVSGVSCSNMYRPDTGTEGGRLSSSAVRAATKDEIERYLLAKMTGLWAPEVEEAVEAA